MSNSVFSVVTDRLIAEMEKGVVPWRVPWATGLPRSLSTGDQYRGFNALVWVLVSEQHSTPFWATFNRVKELGGVIRKGEKSVPITFWKEVQGKEKEGEESSDEQGGRKRLMCQYYRVFNSSQADWPNGEPKAVLNWRQAERGRQTNGPIQVAEAEKIIAEMADAPRIEHRGLVAYYSPDTDCIKIPPAENFSSPAGYYGTLFHEIGHATGHPRRLNRFGVDDKPSREEYSKEELIAELSSCFLCNSAGVVPDYPQAASYIMEWAKRLRNDPRILVSAAASAQRATELVLGISPERARVRDKAPDEEVAITRQGEKTATSSKEEMPVKESPEAELQFTRKIGRGRGR